MRHVSPLWLVVFVGVWWFLASPRADAWAIGASAVLAGVLLHVGLGGRSRPGPRIRGLLGFLPFFVNQMVRGGLDVSRRALTPSLPLNPDLVRYRVHLPAGVARVFFVNSISLLPGTFSARVRDDEITVHRLDPEISPEDVLRTLETKVATLFGVRPARGAER